MSYNIVLLHYCSTVTICTIVSAQVDKNTNADICAVPFLSRAAVNLCWYYYTLYSATNYIIQCHQLHYTVPPITLYSATNYIIQCHQLHYTVPPITLYSATNYIIQCHQLHYTVPPITLYNLQSLIAVLYHRAASLFDSEVTFTTVHMTGGVEVAADNAAAFSFSCFTPSSTSNEGVFGRSRDGVLRSVSVRVLINISLTVKM